MTTDLLGLRNELFEDYYKRFPTEVLAQIEGAAQEELLQLLETVPQSLAVLWIQRMTPAKSAPLLPALSDTVRQALFSLGDLNRIAALVAQLTPEDREQVLVGVAPEIRKEVDSLSQYPATSVGHLMDTRVITLRPDATVEEATSRIKAASPRRVQDLFLVNEEAKVVGWVAVEDLIPMSRTAPLSQVSRGLVPTVRGIAPREEALEIIQKHRLRTIPVVDFDGRLLGVLRQEELINAAQGQMGDDLVTMVGAGRDETALSSPFLAVRKRLPWLEINLVTAFLAASVVALFEGTIARFTALAVLLPVVAGQSGNTGAQALAVTMRGLALREVRLRQWARVAGKEILAGGMNGIAVALTTSIAVFIWSRSLGLSLVIGTSMVISMIVAGMSGAVIPMGLTRLGQDPAQSSSIILTTVTDIVGFFTFLGIATMLAGMLSDV